MDQIHFKAHFWPFGPVGPNPVIAEKKVTVVTHTKMTNYIIYVCLDMHIHPHDWSRAVLRTNFCPFGKYGPTGLKGKN
jgi:hypothetical protein